MVEARLLRSADRVKLLCRRSRGGRPPSLGGYVAGNGGHEWGARRRRALMLPILPVCGRKDRASNLPTTTGCLPAPRTRGSSRDPAVARCTAPVSLARAPLRSSRKYRHDSLHVERGDRLLHAFGAAPARPWPGG